MTNVSENGAGNDRPEPIDGALAASAVMNLLIGLLLTVMGLGHLYGVLVTASWRGYAYDFRSRRSSSSGSRSCSGPCCASRRCAVWLAGNELPGTAH
jgi:hypothetical protein